MKKCLISRDIRQKIFYIVVAIAVNLLISAIAIFVFGVRYSTDDDLSMAYIAYGIYMRPSARIVFSNVLIGWVMKTLFLVKSTINWQSALYFVGLCVSGFVSLYMVMKEKKVKLYFLWIVFVICFFYCSFVSITYTVVSAYISSQGYFAFFLAVKKRDNIWMILSGIIIVYASLIRFESVMAISMSAIISWAIIVLSVVKNEKRFDLKEFATKHICPYLVLGFSVGLFYMGNRVAYLPEEWASYYDYYVLRGEVLDDCSVVTMNDVKRQRELGLSEAMAESLNAWYFNDPEVYNKDLFGLIDEVSTQARDEYIKHPLKDMWINVYSAWKSQFMFRVSVLVFVFLLLIACLESKEHGWIKPIGLLGSILPFFVQMFVYSAMGRYANVVEKELPVRLVEITVMGFFLCYVLIEMGFEENKEATLVNSRFELIILVVCLLCTIILQPFNHYKLRGFSFKSESAIENEYSFLNDGHIYIMEYQALQQFMNAYGVWQNPPMGFLHNFITLGGCEVNYPYLIEKQEELGVSNPYKSLYTRDDVYLVSMDNPSVELAFLQDVYGENIGYELVDVHNKLRIYNFFEISDE